MVFGHLNSVGEFLRIFNMRSVEFRFVALVVSDVGEVVWGTWEDNVVCDDNSAFLDKAVALKQLKIRKVLVFPVVDEDKVECSLVIQTIAVSVTQTRNDCIRGSMNEGNTIRKSCVRDDPLSNSLRGS